MHACNITLVNIYKCCYNYNSIGAWFELGSRKTDNYIREAKLFLDELFTILKTKGSLTIDEISKELDKNRNFVSAFVNACVAFDFCDIKVTNSKTVTLKGLGEQFDPEKYKLVLAPITEEEEE